MALYFSFIVMKGMNLCISTFVRQEDLQNTGLEPIALDFSQGMKVKELKTAENLIEENLEF